MKFTIRYTCIVSTSIKKYLMSWSKNFKEPLHYTVLKSIKCIDNLLFRLCTAIPILQ